MELKRRLEQLRMRVDAEEQDAGERLYRRNIPRLVQREQNCLTYEVADRVQTHVVTLPLDASWHCDCSTFEAHQSCRHLLAAVLVSAKDHLLQEMIRRKSLQLGEELQQYLSCSLPLNQPLMIKPSLVLTLHREKQLSIGMELSIGTEKMYAVRSLSKFLRQLSQGETIVLGRATEVSLAACLIPAAERSLLMLFQGLTMSENGQQEGGGKRIQLPQSMVPEVLELLGGMSSFDVVVEADGQKTVFHRQRMHSGPVEMVFRLDQDARELLLKYQLPSDMIPVTQDYGVVWRGDHLLQVPEEQRELLRRLDADAFCGEGVIRFSKDHLQEVLMEMIPQLRTYSVVEIDPALNQRIETMPLQGELYLDTAGRGVVAELVFRYGEWSFHPFAAKEQQGAISGKLILRDRVKEQALIRILMHGGFHLREGKAYLTGDDRLYRFSKEGLPALQELCNVFAHRDFQKIAPRTPTLRGSIQMGEGRVKLLLWDEQQPLEEIAGILEALYRKRSYYRLKDGAFLDLAGQGEWTSLAETALMGGQEDFGGLSPMKAIEMMFIARDANLPVEANERLQHVMEILRSGGGSEQDDSGIALHPYQQKGLHWLKTLDHLHLGGILADEMGLGKTVQIIALLRTRRTKGKPSLIVSPSSLTYNWLSELNRFAPELSVMVLSGTAAQRHGQLDHVHVAGDIDVVITSYPLIRRDIDKMEQMAFRFAILDEAQYIKNAASAGALAVKRLQADTRLALTGTPMENGVGELWSIFDFVLPGFFPPFTTFMRRYGTGDSDEGLRRKIRPFLLRRLKREVMAELPEKIETRLTAPMTGEQQLVYRAAMVRLRDRVNQVVAEKGMNRGRMDVLAAMTELRQVCCHPALLLPDYEGSSGKLELLMDMLPTALENGRRVLLFSQFTSMLKLIRKRLERHQISALYLDGATPAQERTQQVERFNGGEGDVFLISLKAGGTGLNLTGADMVIHYDPWWNPAAEDQATDRAHRIGQEKRVEVIRLVTHQSIEEQVVELGERKRKLFDQLITPGDELVTALTEQDIRMIFS